MKITELKTQVALGSYEIDERLVAEAVLKRLTPWRFDILSLPTKRGARTPTGNPQQRR